MAKTPKNDPIEALKVSDETPTVTSAAMGLSDDALSPPLPSTEPPPPEVTVEPVAPKEPPPPPKPGRAVKVTAAKRMATGFGYVDLKVGDIFRDSEYGPKFVDNVMDATTTEPAEVI